MGLVALRRLSEELPLPPPPSQSPPAFVCGGTRDCIVDVTAVRELAAHCGVEPQLLENHAHDLMLVRLHRVLNYFPDRMRCTLVECSP